MTAYEEGGGLLAPGWAGSRVEAAVSDLAYVQGLLDAEAALTRAQAALGEAPVEAAESVSAGARAERYDVRSLALRARAAGNPVLALVSDLKAELPEPHREFVHRGATSQDIVDTATMLVAARALDLVLDDLARTERSLAALAAAHRDTVMAGRTLTQHAVPTTFGLKAAGWRSLVLDARDRVRAVRDALPAQLGGAAGTLAALGSPELVAEFARETGLAAPALPWHTLRTPVADLAGALAFTAGALGKLAADVLTLSRTEIAEVSEGAGGGSSAMPHKANPVRATLIAAGARQGSGLASALYGSLVAEDERPPGAWHAEWAPLRDLLRIVGGAAENAGDLIADLRVDTEAMRRNLDLTGGLIVSERLTAALGARVGRARAKELLTSLAARVRRGEGTLAQLLSEPPEFKDLDLDDLTDPAGYTGAAGVLTDRALERR
ncbi:3-carboxy-cis,cis-muconate cycloisomerase [Streptomyces sp. TRM66268-LWL]|uniref:3-carboxy-cis,cis-muconate cycloisomerase n=1 Tax=Streptomyces polyasparticus TaxID=2767826 RepID=A0ABR7SKF9_9ACTN|nr:3-carboxy-cis,cis-muconate cycloisomerase [Streptomyces polyasparticus]MBC9715908.1 3-carboxy-cis,cis-muconate cycloisomerase [Streptomyces polyasparticus]